MRLKSYFAATVDAAMAMANQELGPDALVVNTRNAPPEARHLGEYEVVMAMVAPADSAPPVVSENGPGQPRVAERDLLARELAGIRQDLEALRRSVGHSSIAPPAWLQRSAQLSEIFEALVNADVEPRLAQQIMAGVHERLTAENAPDTIEARATAWPALADPAARLLRRTGWSFDAPRLDRALRAEIERLFPVDATLGPGNGAKAIVALVGPPGSGKTATLAKLAIQFGLHSQRPTQFLSMDPLRVGASEQLRTYAAILGVGFQIVETARTLSQAIEEHQNKSLLLIDTPGYGPADMEEARELARALASRPDIDLHLVLPANLKSDDLAAAVDRFAIFRPGKLLFTRLDETRTSGQLLGHAARTAKPLSFLAAGQRVPEDLEPATKERILRLILPADSIDRALSAA